VNSIYLYDDKIVFAFNYKDGTKSVSLAELEEELSSDLEGATPPQKIRNGNRFGFFYEKNVAVRTSGYSTFDFFLKLTYNNEYDFSGKKKHRNFIYFGRGALLCVDEFVRESCRRSSPHAKSVLPKRAYRRSGIRDSALSERKIPHTR
jgi:hypothetical protein